MTKEEARKRLLDWIQYATDPERVPFMDEPCSDEEIILAMRIGADALSHPSLPSDIDEAAEEYAYTNWEDNDYHTGASEGLPFDAIGHTENCFKAGAEWMAGQGVKAHCIESSNPASDSPDKRPHCITLIYDKNENTPYVLAGDEIEIILRKKQ